jgi:hypothetical protein
VEDESVSTADPLGAIIAAITPFIGEHMARSAARAHCEKLGIKGEKPTPEQLKQLIARLESGLHIFIGREKAGAVMAALRQSLLEAA